MTTRLYMRRLLALSLIIQMSLPTLAIADASSCKEGEKWDVGLGRCVMNRSTSELQGDVTVCGSFSNPEDRQKCYTENANTSAIDAGHTQLNGGMLGATADAFMQKENTGRLAWAGITIGLGTIMIVSYRKNPACMATLHLY
jgi:hypothetical protein